MTLKTLIEAGKTHTRAAVIEDGEAVGFSVVANEGEAAGPLYLAQVKKVDAKINAAFLDLGGAGEGFLPFRHAKALKRKLGTNISGLVTEGEKILVKITAPASEQDKLPLVTANPMIAGRYVLTGRLPGKALLARGIDDEEARKALQQVLDEAGEGGSLIIRSAAQNVDKTLVLSEIEAQKALWESLEKAAEKPGVVLPAPDPLERILRDEVPAGADEILIDDRVAVLKAQKLAAEKWPDLAGKISHFQDGNIMETFGVAERLDYVRDGRVPLPSGGFITIEETSAMVVVDVNSGAGRKGASPGALHLLTNLEAAKVTAREVRFQNLFGLITIDFIDMKTQADREQVTEGLKAGLAGDKMAFETAGINRFGLLTIKRARRGETLKTLLERTGTQ